MRGALFILLALLSVACLDEYDVEGMTYPCRSEEDCVEGFDCHPSRYVCVQAGTSSTASGLDSGTPD